jgi:hypothetical protein
MIGVHSSVAEVVPFPHGFLKTILEPALKTALNSASIFPITRECERP